MGPEEGLEALSYLNLSVRDVPPEPLLEPLPELPRPEVRRQLRKKMGLTITRAAQLAYVSRQTFARWESGGAPGPLNQRIYHKLLMEWEEA